MGLMPSAQFGSVATVNSPINYSSGTPIQVYGYVGNSFTTSPLNISRDSPTTTNPVTLSSKHGQIIPSSSTMAINLNDLTGRLSSSFDILSFRIAEASQRYKEVTQCAKQGYKEQLEAHWNVRLSEALSDHCRYIGGDSSDIAISEVLNSNLSAADSFADIKGKGVGTGYGSEVFEANEHGILMCVYHAVPVLDYILSGHDYKLMHTLTTDLPLDLQYKI